MNNSRSQELIEKRQLPATSGHLFDLGICRKKASHGVAILFLCALASCEEPSLGQLSDLHAGVTEVVETGARQAWLPLGGSTAIEITSPQDGAAYPLQTPMTPVTVEFTLTDWPGYPGAGYAVSVYVDNTFVGQQFTGNSVIVDDVPAGYHVIALVLADTTQGGWQEYDGTGARDHVAVVVQTDCVVPADCDTGTPCSTYDCVNSVCEYTPTPMCCLSTLQCPPGDMCLGTVCQGCSINGDCDDANVCTTDTCDVGACSHVWVSGPEGICCAVGLPGSVCNDWQYCTIDSCNEMLGHCESVDSGDPLCCETEPDPDCDDANACTADQCVAHQCTHIPVPGCCNEDSDCDDQSICTLDVCTAHVCEHSFDVEGGSGCCETHVDCGPGGMSDDNDPSTIDYCQNFVCNHVVDPHYCDDSGTFPCGDDGNECTAEVCADNSCTHVPVPDCCLVGSDCASGDPCVDTYSCTIPQGQTVGACDYTPKADCCHADEDCRDAADACTQDSTCEGNACIDPSDDPPSCCNQDSDCDDQCACTTDSCDEDTHTCIYAPGPGCCFSHLDCDDGNELTVDTCESGCACSNIQSASCVNAEDPCDDGNPCTTDTCHLATERCRHQWIPSCCLKSTDCDDSDSCTKEECKIDNTCSNDAIASCCSSAASCNDSDICTTDMCVAHECRFFNIGGCCEADMDCQTGDPCYVGTCDLQINQCQFAVDYDNPTYQCCSTAGDCFDGTSCTTETCVNHQCQYAEAPGCCGVDGDCDDGSPCTYDECSGGLCRFLPPDQAPPGSGIPPLCCVADGDCASDNDTCTTDTCAGGLCSYAPVDPCVLDIPYQQSFVKCSALSVMHWGLHDGGPATAENWHCSVDGALGPDKHLLFDWLPEVESFDSYLLSPWFDLAGYDYVTVQFERAYDHYQSAIQLGLYYSEAGPPFVPTDALWKEAVSADLEADIVDFTLPTPSANMLFWLRVGGTNTYNLDAYEIDSFRVCEGRAPHFTASPPLEVIFVNHAEAIGLEIEDQDLADTIQFHLLSAPDFVSLTNQQDTAPAHTVDLSVAPDDAGDAGPHTVVIRVTDGCLIDELTVELEVYQPGGYVVWWPDGVAESHVTALTGAVGGAGRQAQVITDLSLVDQFLDETPPPAGVFVPLGVYGVKHVLTDAESSILVPYLLGGGKVYLEGGDTFAFDSWTSVHSYFRVSGVSDGPQTLDGPVLGGHFAWDLDFDLSSHYWYNNFLDSLDTMEGTVVGQVTGHGITAVAYQDVTTGYRTIAGTIPFAALLDTAPHIPTDLMDRYLDFMESGWPPCSQDEQCDEGNVCTADTCVASACDNTPDPPDCTQCRDDTYCGVNEACGPDLVCLGIPGTLRQSSLDTPMTIGPGPSTHESAITLVSTHYVHDINVEVDIAHSYIGDLRVTLTHGGQSVELATPNPADSSHNLYVTYDIGVPSTGDLSAFHDTTVSGDWTLTVEDTAAFDGGTLEHWRLHVVEIDCVTAPDCNDGNPCTQDLCDAQVGCTHIATDGQSCDDGNACTEGEVCVLDVCGSGTPVNCDDGNVCTDDWCDPDPAWGCLHANNTEPCGDGNACTQGDACSGGLCTSGNPVDCNDQDACTTDSCDPGTGCVNSPVTCNDGNVCTTDSCDPASGCVYVNNAAPCDDGDICTEEDTCSGGACVISLPVICDPPPGEPCRIVLCDSTFGCDVSPEHPAVALPAGVPCNVEYSPCELFSCDGAGQCASIQALDPGAPCRPQGDQDPCMAYACQGDHECVPELPAPDGLACQRQCGAGACQSGSCALTSYYPAGTTCDGPGECQRWECDGVGVCVDTLNPADNGTECRAPDPCQHWTCQAGECRFESTKPAGQACRWTTSCREFKCTEDMRCTDTADASDDVLLCHQDIILGATSCIDFDCADSICRPLGSGCPDDGKACTHERCYLIGTQCAGSPVDSDCDDSNLCTDDVCDAVQGCINPDNTEPCDDGDTCTDNDTCAAGTCTGSSVDCNDANACTDDTCDPQAGCQHTNNTGSCSDNDACTSGDSCLEGACIPGAAVDCDDSNLCTDDSCDPAQGCLNQPNINACDDGVACTTGDVCAGGTCAGTPDHGLCTQYQADACLQDNCDPVAGCGYLYTTAPCDDLSACSESDTCSAGICAGTAVNCDDSIACTVDGCDPVSGCSNDPDDGACDDGNPCTVDTCNPSTGCEYAPVDCSAYETDGSLCTLPVCEPWMGGCADIQGVNCDDADPCTDDSCVPATGTCSHVQNTAVCDDGNICTLGDVCSGGVCQGGSALDCDDGNECTFDYCAGGGCVHDGTVYEGVGCDDTSLCTPGIDVCTGGVCTGVLLVCDDADPCTLDLCDPGDGACNYEQDVPEICDGEDNNCNGLVDDGVNNGCGGCADLDPAPGAPCAGGVYVCSGPDSVICEQVTFQGDGCPASPVIEAVIHGQVFDSDADVPLAGVTVQLADRALLKCSTPTYAVTDQLGRFHLPVAVRGQYVLDFIKTGHITSQREITVVSGHRRLGEVYMAPLSGTVTTVSGNHNEVQTVVSADTNVEIAIPPDTVLSCATPLPDCCTTSSCVEPTCCGIENNEVDIRITWYDRGDELPGPLPETSYFTYAFSTHPSGLEFSNPVTVKLRNTPQVEAPENPGQFIPMAWTDPFAVGSTIPLGIWNPATGQWEHATQATVVDETWIEFATTHFTAWDANLPVISLSSSAHGKPHFSDVSVKNGKRKGGAGKGQKGTLPRKKKPATISPECEGDPGGSVIGRADGSLRTGIDLPGTVLDGEFYGLSLSYDSRTACPRLYLASSLDVSAYAPEGQPDLLGFAWELAGAHGKGFYSPSQGINKMATLVPARDAAGQWLPSGPHQYYLTLGTRHVGEYYWTGEFGEPPIPTLPGQNTGRAPREPYWQHQYLSGTAYVVNRRESPFGAGWSLDGLMTLHEDQFSGDELIIEGASTYVLHALGRAYHYAGLDVSPADESTGSGQSKYEAGFQHAKYMARDNDGNTYFGERNFIRRISPDGVVSLIAGCGDSPADCQTNYGADNYCEPSPETGKACDAVPAVQVYLDGVWDLAVDSNGVVYFTVFNEDVIRNVDKTGLSHVMAGNPLVGCSADCCLPAGIAIDEKEDGVYVYYVSSTSGNESNYTVKRVHPGSPTTPDNVLGAGPGPFSGAFDILLLSNKDPLAPGPGYLRTILVAENGSGAVQRVDFNEVPTLQAGQPVDWAFQPGSYSLFAGNGAPVQVPFTGGDADMVGIGMPRGLAQRDENNVYMSVQGDGSDDMILRAVRIYDEAAQQHVWKLSRVAGEQSGQGALKDGVDPLDVALGQAFGLMWSEEESALYFIVSNMGSIWTIGSALQEGNERFTTLEKPTADTRKLWETDGTFHEFSQIPGASGVFRVTRSQNRWGRAVEYAYDPDNAVLDKVFLPHDRAYLLTYGPDDRLESVLLHENCSVSDCSSPSPLWEENGQPRPVLFDFGGDELAQVDFQDGGEKRQFDYDSQHRMTRRYHGEDVAPPGEPGKWVEYVWEDDVVRRVLFHDSGQAWKNREYVHSQERALMAPDGSNATPSSPLAQDADADWDLTIDAIGEELWTRLDATGQTLEIKDGHGRRTEFIMGGNDLVTIACRHTSEASQECDYEVVYTYDEKGRIVSEKIGDPDTKSEWKYSYDGAPYSLPAWILNAEQELTRLVYDEQGNLTEASLPTQWTENNGLYESTGPEYTAKWFYDQAVAPAGRPVSFRDPNCVAAGGVDCEVAFEYSAGNLGNITRVVSIEGGDPNETTDDVDVTIQYDPLGFAEQVRLPYESSGQKQTAAWSMTHDRWGKVKTATNPQGVAWTYDYDDPMAQGCASCSSGSVLGSVLGPDGALVVLERDFAGRVTGAKAGYRDGAGDHFLVEKSYQYDLVGKLLGTSIDGTDSAVDLAYDELERLASVAVSSGAGLLQWSYAYDLLDRTSAVTAPGGGLWQMAYNHLSAVNSITETGKSRTATLQRDMEGRVTNRTIGSQVGSDPTWSYVRDAVGRLKQVLHPAGTPVEQTDLTRDESGNITEVKRDGTVTDTVTRDANDRVTSVARTCQDGFASDYSVEYDLAGEVKSVSSQVGENAQQEPVRLKHQYGYNNSTDLSTVSLHRKDGTGAWGPALLELDYTYDDYNRLERIELSPLSAAVQFYRDQAGRVDRIDHQAAGQTRNRVQVAYADNTSWLASLTMGAPDAEDVADPPLLRLAYVYDGAGRIVRIDETGQAGPDATRIFTYDDASRLKKAEDHHGFPDEDKFVWEYNYNTAGEREWKKVDGALEDYLWDGLGMLDQVTGETTKDFAFDNAGNLTSIAQGSDTLVFGYDKSGRVSSVEDASTTVTYRYGPDERRVARTVNGATTRYFTDGLVTYELDGATTEIQRAYVFLPNGFSPIMLVTFESGLPDTVYFYLNDHLSTPRIVTNNMGQGVWRARYAPFGEVIERCDTDQDGVWNDPCPLSQPIRFPGQWDDGIEGVWYNWHRFYLPEYGIYGRVDPVFQVGARVWDYVGGNPVGGIDPEGLWEMPSKERPFPMDPMQELFGPLGSWEDYLDFYKDAFREARPPPINEGARPFWDWNQAYFILDAYEMEAVSLWNEKNLPECQDRYDDCTRSCRGYRAANCGGDPTAPSCESVCFEEMNTCMEMVW